MAQCDFLVVTFAQAENRGSILPVLMHVAGVDSESPKVTLYGARA